MYIISYVYKNGVRKEVAEYNTLKEARNDIEKALPHLRNSIFVSIVVEKEMSIDGYATIVESYKIKGEREWKVK